MPRKPFKEFVKSKCKYCGIDVYSVSKTKICYSCTAIRQKLLKKKHKMKVHKLRCMGMLYIKKTLNRGN